MWVTPDIFEAAGRLDAEGLRSLDAVHLAAALYLGDGLGSVVTCRHRLASAARSHGVAVNAPA